MGDSRSSYLVASSGEDSEFVRLGMNKRESHGSYIRGMCDDVAEQMWTEARSDDERDDGED